MFTDINILLWSHCTISISDTTNQIKQAALPDQTTGGMKAYLVVLFDNQLDRVIKILPSRSSRGKYFVEPRGYLMVNITIDSHDPFEKISFKAFDQDRTTQILLNNSLSIELIPSTNQSSSHRIVLTPQGTPFCTILLIFMSIEAFGSLFASLSAIKMSFLLSVATSFKDCLLFDIDSKCLYFIKDGLAGQSMHAFYNLQVLYVSELFCLKMNKQRNICINGVFGKLLSIRESLKCDSSLKL